MPPLSCSPAFLLLPLVQCQRCHAALLSFLLLPPWRGYSQMLCRVPAVRASKARAISLSPLFGGGRVGLVSPPSHFTLPLSLTTTMVVAMAVLLLAGGAVFCGSCSGMRDRLACRQRRLCDYLRQGDYRRCVGNPFYELAGACIVCATESDVKLNLLWLAHMYYILNPTLTPSAPL